MSVTKEASSETKPRCPVCGSSATSDWDRDCGTFYTCDPCGHQFSLGRMAQATAESCTWTLTPDPDCEMWEPSCGGDPWQFEVGGPITNKMKFCCFCARPLTEFVRPMEIDDDN